MIPLFTIKTSKISTKSFNHILHGSVVTDFEKEFCKYVGAKYGCSTNSATSALFLCLKLGKPGKVKIPSLIPPVVLNSIIHSGNKIEFYDNVTWVGHSYLFHSFPGYRIIDSAQRVDRNQFKKEADPSDLMVFSFYPTKPVGSCDGGMIVSNDKDKIEHLRSMTMNGMGTAKNSWEREVLFPGWKMYMNSIQAQMALESLGRLDEKKSVLKKIREMYNRKLGLTNSSDHLYRLYCRTESNPIISTMNKHGIVCGKHYEATHIMRAYFNENKCPLSEKAAKFTMSIPFHENLTIQDAYEVIKVVKEEAL